MCFSAPGHASPSIMRTEDRFAVLWPVGWRPLGGAVRGPLAVSTPAYSQAQERSLAFQRRKAVTQSYFGEPRLVPWVLCRSARLPLDRLELLLYSGYRQCIPSGVYTALLFLGVPGTLQHLSFPRYGVPFPDKIRDPPNARSHK